MTSGQANFFQSLGWAVLNSLWQLALLWVIYQVITAMFSNSRASAKSLLASSLLMIGFGWFVYTFITVYSSNAVNEGSLSSVLTNTNENPALGGWLKQILPIASALYLILLVIPLLGFIRNYRYVQIIRQHGLTKINVEWRMFVTRIAGQMNIQKKVNIWVSELVSSPVTIGFLKPVILVPLAAINHLTPQQLEAVLLHELSHIKRSDYFINLIINFIQAILYFNPFVKAFVKIVEREREKSCDEMVLQFQYDSHEYASALLTLEKTSHINKPLAIAAAGKKNDLLNRIESILGVEKKQIFSFQRVAGLFTGLLIVFLLNAILIISKQPSGNKVNSIGDVSSSFNFFDGYDKADYVPATEELKASEPVINHVVATTSTRKEQDESLSPVAEPLPMLAPIAYTNPSYRQAGMEIVEEAPQLKKYQEDQVQVALEASKKVLESAQWKYVEKTMAEVFTASEKEKLKSTYENEINKIDWNEWENNLRLAYNKVDWENVNSQLANAVQQVRIDSIQSVYRQALSQLEEVKSTLIANDVKGIPDTDVSLKRIEQERKDALRALNNVRAIRAKKIVRL
ncbi:hypothetical protein CAP36_00150 [Chitinophagaceae bacterium IBVUCB2]|nr:hypothetical protein CAP36_00150 [Chitinophagaceae bacterium IBVUCB2]